MPKDIGIVGAGYWGKNLIRTFHSLGRLHTVCDASAELLDKFKTQYPAVSLSTDISSLLKSSDIKAVVIATPAHSHYALAKKCLEAGKHIFVEKPFTTSTAEAEELIALAKSKSLTLMTGFTFIYSPPVIKIKEIIDSGELGEIYYIYSQRLNLGIVRQDVNAWWNLAPHDVSIISYFMNDDIAEVNGRGVCFLQDSIEDVVSASLVFKNKKAAFIHVSWLDPNKIRKMTIVGSKKMLAYDDTSSDMKVTIFDKGIDKKSIDTRFPTYDTYSQFQLIQRAGDVHIPKIDFTEPLKKECSHFIECYEKGSVPKTGAKMSLDVVKIMEAVQKSIKSGGMKITVS